MYDTAFLLILTTSYFFFQGCLHGNKGYIYIANLVKQINTQANIQGKIWKENKIEQQGPLAISERLIFKFQQKPASNQEKL